MNKMDSARLEGLLDWLAEEVAARLPAGGAQQTALEQPPVCGPGQGELTPLAGAGQGMEPPAARPAEAGRDATPPEDPEPADPAPDVARNPSHAAQLMSRLAIGLLVAVVLINVPLGLHGTALARIIPSRDPLIIRNGLLVRESDQADVYVYQDGEFRWITDLEVFQHYRYQWRDVQTVAPGFLADYPSGRPLYLVAKCPGSPHIYRLESGVRRWIVDVATFEAEGHQWADVRIMDCYTLSRMPAGETIPPGQGPAPEP